MEKHDRNDPVAIYVREVSNIEPLTEDEETSLFQELRDNGNGDKTKVKRRLIESKLVLVVSIAQKHSAVGFPVLDLIQEGNIGLAKAVRGFTERPIGDFTTYASICIEDAIRKALGK